MGSEVDLRRLTCSLLPLALAYPCSGPPAQTVVPLAAVGPGCLVVKAKLAREDASIERHLLLDLMCPAPLVYDPREALFLEVRDPGTPVDLELGDLTLKAVPMSLARLRLLERLTRDHATELKEVPVAGILGASALPGRLEIDGEKLTLRVLPEALAGDEPEKVPGRWVLPLAPGEGPPRVQASLEEKAEGLVYLATGRPDSFLLAGALDDAGLAAAPARRLTAGEANLAGIVPFRAEQVERLIYRVPGPMLGAVGWDFLRSFRFQLDPVNRLLVLDRVRFEPYAVEEEEYLLAERQGSLGLEGFLKSRPEGPLAVRAARRIFELLAGDEAGPPAAVAAAGRRWVGLAPAADRPRASLAVGGALLDLHPVPEETLALVKAGLEAAKGFPEREPPARLQHLAGRYWLAREEYRQARIHLLNAVFSLLHEGPVNLDMGRAWKGLERPSRAAGSFARAMLDVERAGPEALSEMERLRDGMGGRTGLVRELLERLAARPTAYRPPGEAKGTDGRRPLLELFTGADCRPSRGVAMAWEGLQHYYGREIGLLCHHLHAPLPDPLACRAGLLRARELGVRRSPTLIVDGQPLVSRGARPREAAQVFANVKAAVEVKRARPAEWRLAGTAVLDAGKGVITGEVRVAGPSCRVEVWLVERAAAYPGLNEVFFHWYLSRALLTPAGGAEPDAEGRIKVRADLAAIWQGLREELEELETSLVAQDFAFRWKPTAPDPAELLLVAVAGTPAESVVIVPAGPAQAALEAEEREEAEKERQLRTESGPATRPGPARVRR